MPEVTTSVQMKRRPRHSATHVSALWPQPLLDSSPCTLSSLGLHPTSPAVIASRDGTQPKRNEPSAEQSSGPAHTRRRSHCERGPRCDWSHFPTRTIQATSAIAKLLILFI